MVSFRCLSPSDAVAGCGGAEVKRECSWRPQTQVPVEVAWWEVLKAREARMNLVTQMALKGMKAWEAWERRVQPQLKPQSWRRHLMLRDLAEMPCRDWVDRPWRGPVAMPHLGRVDKPWQGQIPSPMEAEMAGQSLSPHAQPLSPHAQPYRRAVGKELTGNGSILAMTVDDRPRQQKATTTECLAAKNDVPGWLSSAANPQGCKMPLTTHRHSTACCEHPSICLHIIGLNRPTDDLEMVPPDDPSMREYYITVVKWTTSTEAAVNWLSWVQNVSILTLCIATTGVCTREPTQCVMLWLCQGTTEIEEVEAEQEEEAPKQAHEAKSPQDPTEDGNMETPPSYSRAISFEHLSFDLSGTPRPARPTWSQSSHEAQAALLAPSSDGEPSVGYPHDSSPDPNVDSGEALEKQGDQPESPDPGLHDNLPPQGPNPEMANEDENNASFGLSFPRKLWRIVEDATFTSVHWNDKGDTVVIEADLFQREVLQRRGVDQICETDSIKSFIRELNLYGFRKIRPSGRSAGRKKMMIYRNSNFQRDKPLLLQNIQRKGDPRTTSQPATGTTATPKRKKRVMATRHSPQLHHHEFTQEAGGKVQKGMPTACRTPSQCSFVFSDLWSMATAGRDSPGELPESPPVYPDYESLMTLYNACYSILMAGLLVMAPDEAPESEEEQGDSSDYKCALCEQVKNKPNP
nr:unnamed protein product [Rangifer tarandus platyrhynchus]